MTGDQTRFRAALLDGARPAPPGLSDGRGQPAGRRFDVYRNNVVSSLIDALGASFPAVRSLLGARGFHAVADRFLRQHPPNTPLLMRYGAGFADFLDTAEDMPGPGYLGDVARLEQAQREAYHAADAAPLGTDDIAAIPPEDMAQARLRLAPAVRLIQSPWPVHAIWLYATQTGAPKPAAVAQDVLISRPEFDPVLTVLPTGGAAFVRALMDEAALATALDRATEAAPGFDLQSMLAVLLDSRSVTAIDPTE